MMKPSKKHGERGILKNMLKLHIAIFWLAILSACMNFESKSSILIREIAKKCKTNENAILFDAPGTKFYRIITLSINFRLKNEAPQKRQCILNQAGKYKIKIVDEKLLDNLKKEGM